MKYIITIRKVEKVKKLKREWERLYDDSGFERVQAKDSEATQYGYQTFEAEEDESTQIYEQIIEGELDLVSVINAVNKQK